MGLLSREKPPLQQLHSKRGGSYFRWWVFFRRWVYFRANKSYFTLSGIVRTGHQKATRCSEWVCCMSQIIVLPIFGNISDIHCSSCNVPWSCLRPFLHYKGCIYCLCAYTTPTNSLVTRSVALSGNPCGMLYSSFVIFWKHRYSFLGGKTSIYQLIREPFLVEWTA